MGRGGREEGGRGRGGQGRKKPGQLQPRPAPSKACQPPGTNLRGLRTPTPPRAQPGQLWREGGVRLHTSQVNSGFRFIILSHPEMSFLSSALHMLWGGAWWGG